LAHYRLKVSDERCVSLVVQVCHKYHWWVGNGFSRLCCTKL